jgi:hypothetical protein
MSRPDNRLIPLISNAVWQQSQDGNNQPKNTEDEARIGLDPLAFTEPVGDHGGKQDKTRDAGIDPIVLKEPSKPPADKVVTPEIVRSMTHQYRDCCEKDRCPDAPQRAFALWCVASHV